MTKSKTDNKEVLMAPQKYFRTLTMQNERYMIQSVRQNSIKYCNLS